MVQQISVWVIFRQFMQHSWRLISCLGLLLCMLNYSYGWFLTFSVIIASFFLRLLLLSKAVHLLSKCSQNFANICSQSERYRNEF